MAFSVLENGARAVMVFSTAPTIWTMGLHMTKTDWDEDDAITLVSAIRAGLAAGATKPWTANDALQEIVIYDQRSEFAPVYRPVITPLSGSNTGERTDKASAVVITLRTSHRGRSGRGRMYLGGQSEGQMSSGRWAAAHITAVETMVTNLINNIVNVGWVVVIKSQYENKQFLNPAHPHAVTSWEVRNDIPGSQDRRNHRP